MLTDGDIKTKLFLHWLGIFFHGQFVINIVLCLTERLNDSHVFRCSLFKAADQTLLVLGLLILGCLWEAKEGVARRWLTLLVWSQKRNLGWTLECAGSHGEV